MTPSLHLAHCRKRGGEGGRGGGREGEGEGEREKKREVKCTAEQVGLMRAYKAHCGNHWCRVLLGLHVINKRNFRKLQVERLSANVAQMIA